MFADLQCTSLVCTICQLCQAPPSHSVLIARLLKYTMPLIYSESVYVVPARDYYTTPLLEQGDVYKLDFGMRLRNLWVLFMLEN